MDLYLLIGIIILVIVVLFNQFWLRTVRKDPMLTSKLDLLDSSVQRIETSVKDEVKSNRQELNNMLAVFQTTFIETIHAISNTQLEQLKTISDSSQLMLNNLNRTIEEKFNSLLTRTDENNKTNRDDLSKSIQNFSESVVLQLDKIIGKVEEKLKELNDQAKMDGKLMRESLEN